MRCQFQGKWALFSGDPFRHKIHRFLIRTNSGIRATRSSQGQSRKIITRLHLKFKFPRSPPLYEVQPLTMKMMTPVFTTSTSEDMPLLVWTPPVKKKKTHLSLTLFEALLPTILLPLLKIQASSVRAARHFRLKLLSLSMDVSCVLHKLRKKWPRCRNFFYRRKVWTRNDILCFWDRRWVRWRVMRRKKQTITHFLERERTHYWRDGEKEISSLKDFISQDWRQIGPAVATTERRRKVTSVARNNQECHLWEPDLFHNSSLKTAIQPLLFLRLIRQGVNWRRSSIWLEYSRSRRKEV